MLMPPPAPSVRPDISRSRRATRRAPLPWLLLHHSQAPSHRQITAANSKTENPVQARSMARPLFVHPAGIEQAVRHRHAEHAQAVGKSRTHAGGVVVALHPAL